MDDDIFGFSKGEIRTIGIVMIVFGIVTTLGLFAFIAVDSYNQLVDKDVRVSQMMANVQSSLEQRADLIPNIVDTIDGSANFEKHTLVDVVKERNDAFSIKSDISRATNVQELQSDSNAIDSAISRLLLLYEQYPTLKTTDQFMSIQSQLASTENQIRLDRNNYNMAVANYQEQTRIFPCNIFARLFGFNTDKWKMFESYQGKTDVPKVRFNL